jgi:hypothetical protein
MTRYTYYGFNLISGDVITELPLRGAAPSWAVNDPGDLGGPTINASGLSTFRRMDVRTSTVPYKCGIAVERDGRIVWTGIITARRYDSTTGVFTLTVPGLLAYWRRRLVTANRVYNQVDQFAIVTDLLRVGGDPTIPLVLNAPPSGVIRDRSIDVTDQKPVFDAIMELADNLNGYEIAIESDWSTLSGVQRVVHNLRLGSPRLGRPASSESLLLLEYPGNVRAYTWDEDGDAFATEVWGVSTSDDGSTLLQVGVNNDLIGRGFPRVMDARQWSDITITDTLTDHITQALEEADGYSDAPTFSVPDDGDTAVGQWVVGDDIRLKITDPRRFPTPIPPGGNPGNETAGLDTTIRLQQATLNPETGLIAMTAFAFPEAVE